MLRGPREQRFLVQREEHAVLEQDPAVDEHRADVGRLRGVHEQGDRIVARREMWLRHVDHDHVGSLADFKRADRSVEAERPRAANRRHAQHLARRQRLGIALEPFLQQRREVHLLEQVRLLLLAARSVPTLA